MNPILYSAITEGAVPSDYGIGVLKDCLSCKVHEERNGSYELTMEYASEGIHASDIVPNAILKVKPNYTDDPQLFRIYKVGKTINGRFEVNAQHISYDLSGKVILSGTANNVTSACVLLTASAGNFTIDTTKSVSADFTITEPSSVRSWFGGKEGSLLDVYGTGEWQYNNFEATLKLNRGEDRGVQIRYGKNLTELSQEIDMSNLVSGIIPYCKTENGITSGSEVSTGLSGFDKVIAIDFTDSIDTESEDDLPTQLANLATAYVSNHNLVTPLNNITLDFVQMKGLTERVDLCDIVHIFFEPLGISASMKCIATTWDCLEERYTETEFGDAKTSIVDTILQTSETAAEAQSDAESKKRVFTTTPFPPYNEGDLWVNGEDILYCVQTKTSGAYEESDWLLATDYSSQSFVEDTIDTMTSLITGVSGGYVVLNRDVDGHPYEILVMDNADMNEANNVIRLNQSGLGISTTGYSGPFTTAITGAGIAADSITTGNLDALKVTIQHLSATMFEGGKISLGGMNNQSGILELKDEAETVIGELTKEGLKFYGAGPVGMRPYVVLNNTDGFKGYDANGNALFWVNRDEFVMTKCVAQNEITACGKIRFLPMTIKVGGITTNDGVAIVALV